MPEHRFASFSPNLVSFLTQLRANNNRDWFQANKARYEEQVREPALDFIEAFADRLEAFAPCFVAMPTKVGGSLMRPYRDIRFAKDKTPYKTNVGIQFRHELGKDVHAPGYYLHIDPDEVFLAAGMWRPAANALAQIRDRIADRPDDWTQVIDDPGLKKQFRLSGASLTRPPRGYDKAHPHIEDLKRKDFIAVADISHGDLTSDRFIDRAEHCFKAADPLMRFLCKSVQVPFEY